MPSMDKRSKASALKRAGLALGIVAAAWKTTAPGAFAGAPASAARPATTAMRGYRLDWMLEKRNGEEGLQTADGYWLGEVGFEKAQAAQGLRYRMRPTSQEYKDGKEVDGLMFQLGPLKLKLGEIFGGSGVNEELRKIKRKIVEEGLSDPKKIEENEYWLRKYGHKRWEPGYVDQSTGNSKQLFRGLSASGFDPLKEERGVTWFEADYGKPWLKKYVGYRLPGFVSEEQVKKEYNSGKLLDKPADKSADK
jgi:hypothetical protein